MKVTCPTLNLQYFRVVILYILVMVFCLFTCLSPVYALDAEQRRIIDSGARYFNVGEDPVCEASSGSTELVGSDNREKVWNFLIGKGLSPPQAAGVMGNLQLESGYDPFNQENGRPWPTAGWGLAQWTGGRRDTLSEAVIAELGPQFYIPTEEAGSMIGTPAEDQLLKFQLDFLFNESNGRVIEKGPTSGFTQPPLGTNEWEGLKTMNTVEEAVLYWEYNYERAGVPALGTRADYGNTVLTELGSVTGGTNPSSETTACEDGGGGSALVGSFAFPVDRHWYDDRPNEFTDPHHDYPAVDIGIPMGENVYSMTDGKIILAPNGTATGGCGFGLEIEAPDGVRYIYCHGSDGGSVDGARQGDEVKAGQLIMHNASTGNSDGPHLHLEIRVNGTSVCPQSLLVGIAQGSPPDVNSLPSSGCSY